MKSEITIRARATKVLAARLARIAVRKHGTMSGCVREASVEFVEKRERKAKLPPLTESEVEELLKKEAA